MTNGTNLHRVVLAIGVTTSDSDIVCIEDVFNLDFILFGMYIAK